MVTDTILWSIEFEYEVAHGLSIGTMSFDQNYWSDISKTVTHTMLGKIEVE